MSENNSLKNLLSNLLEDSLKKSEYMSAVVASFTNLAKQTSKLAEMMVRVHERLDEHEQIMLMMSERKKEPDYSLKTQEKFSKPN